MNFVSYIHEQLKSYLLKESQQLVVAYSGGVDSHVLLHALATLRQQHPFSLSAIHIHHGLSDNADLWQEHCAAVCEQLAVPLQSAKIELKKQPRQSLEALAREARYAKLQTLAPNHSIILLGQHQDDQLETVLLQLKRGAGPKGLAAMARQWQVSTDKNSETGKSVNYFRPLLDITQAQILNYAQQHNLQWQEDESNQDTDFERNFLRQQVLPTLTDRWPQFAKSVSRSASLCAEQQALLDELSQEKLLGIQTPDNTLSIDKLSKLSETWQRQLVRLWLAQQNIPSPSQAVLAQLNKELFAANDDANPIIQWQNWQFRRFDQQLYVVSISGDLTGTHIDWHGEPRIELPQELGCLSFSTMTTTGQEGHVCILDPKAGQISLRFGGYADKIKPRGERQSKPLKQWFKFWKTPPWQRDKVAIVMQNERVQALLLNSSLLINEKEADSPQLQSLDPANPSSSYVLISVIS
jgi:tRNA(Ile)-lysidine synthase